MSIGLSVRKEYCGKTAEWILMPFGTVSGVGRGMGVLDGVVIVEGEEAVSGELGASHLTNGLCDAAVPKLLWAVLVVSSSHSMKADNGLYYSMIKTLFKLLLIA